MALKLSSVASQVIAGVLVAAVLGAFAFVVKFAPQIWQMGLAAVVLATNAFAWLGGITGIPRWVLLLLAAGCLPSLIRLIPLARRKNGPSVKEYNQDRFAGVWWRWSYGIGRTPIEFRAFCPSCDMRVVAISGYAFARGITTRFVCEACDRAGEPCDGDVAAVVGTIERLVDRKIRTGEWRAAVESMRER